MLDDDGVSRVSSFRSIEQQVLGGGADDVDGVQTMSAVLFLLLD